MLSRYLGEVMDDRARFEAWISASPYERSVDRWADDEESCGWPGQYKDYEAELAWCAWKEAISQSGK